MRSPTRQTGATLLAATVAATTLLTLPAPTLALGSRDRARPAPPVIETSRTFNLEPGYATRTFTFRERSGVIVLNRLTVPHGVRVFVEARLPGVAGARVSSWPRGNDPSLSCRRRRTVEICTQAEEWCPMPQATWHFHLVKLSGPAGPIRFDYIVAPPPANG